MAVYSYRLANGQTRWFFIIDLPPDANGRRRQHKRQGFPNQAAALKAEDEARAAYGGADLGADGSVAAELESWLNERELDVQETTLSNYRDVIRCYVVPHIGGRQLYALDKRVIHDLYKKLLKSGGKNGGPLSPTTVRIVHRILSKALGDLGVNVEGVRQPRQAERETMGRKGVWTPAQSAKFLKHHADHRLRAAWVLAIVVGARRGELAGLKWPRVDLDRGVLLLHWQRTTTSNGVVEKAPKGKSKRAVALGPALVAELRAHRERQVLEKADAGVLYHDGGYLFCREDGEPYYPKYFTDQWAKACADAGVPVIALHDARHTSATTGADAGVPEHVMQRRLGHADSRTTREVYTHVLPESERKAAELMEAVLGDAATWSPRNS
ncbi:tyrosine-type recombinase/integrase [Micromonospora sp. DSM 115977]|uniref:Tyrosine-type recombinase/integrase n=1 Tax=Micromonospora reichwaldensis TaxID=3075516 RepID=A0ABU2X1Q7_9ACTN|nr:tyrosine-type recombinase/integrase [Micromonospora sp. DSM 115977]MDT0532123.1 tyrosine-type recombinase/integrase [Micromonospora sp. DSM 115977]